MISGLEKLDLLGASKITARGFARAICLWKDVKAINLRKLRSDQKLLKA